MKRLTPSEVIPGTILIEQGDTIERADSLAGKGKYVTFELLYTEILNKSRTHLGPMYQMSLSRLQTTIENESVWSIL